MYAYVKSLMNESTGLLPSEVSQLILLEHLNLSVNSLMGSLPAAIARLPLLSNLVLSHNLFTGTYERLLMILVNESCVHM